MSTSARKRLRAPSPPVTELPAASSRSALASRVSTCHEIPEFWRQAAASAGVSGTDDFLVHLGRSITRAMLSVGESAEAARVELGEIRRAAHAAIDARFDELAASIAVAEASKSATLERELVAVDIALERLRAESGALREAVAALPESDAEYTEEHAAIASRIDDCVSRLQALPTAVVEPPFVGLLADVPTLLSSILGFGRVLAPLSITAADLSLERTPRNVRPGVTTSLRLSLGSRHAAQCLEELAVSFELLGKCSCVEATLEEPGLVPQSLRANLRPNAEQRCLVAFFDIPPSASVSATVNFSYVAGYPIHKLTCCIGICLGVIAPFVLENTSTRSPSISPEGRIYCPLGDDIDVLVFDADGSSLPSLPAASIGLVKYQSWTAFVPGGTASLLLTGYSGELSHSRLVALDPASNVVRWMSTPGAFYCCTGITALPSLGVVMMADCGSLVAFRLSDGTRAARHYVGLGGVLAADPATGTLFGEVAHDLLGDNVDDDDYVIRAWSCSADERGFHVASIGDVAAAGVRHRNRANRPLTVVPAAPGKLVSYLVVRGDRKNTSELSVISLPGFALIHTHVLDGIDVSGLAADPWGSALAVSANASKAVHILSWPLPGMPPLE